MPKSALITLVLVILYLHLPTYAQTQSDMNEEAGNQYVKADAKLNTVYQAVLKKYKNDPLTVHKVKAAQQAWLKYKEAEIEAVFPGENSSRSQFLYGTVLPMCLSEQLQALTENRTKELETWLNMEEGDVCAGSRRN